ncbi:GNAT family N-acetyltransferase [Roseateles sp.]|uniref:GNAT family N-acetyltransferase n=1 Tax=Roseateles sp. TaxID=1971397 RepID=UPI002F40C029
MASTKVGSREWRRDGAVPQDDLDAIRDGVIAYGRQQAQGSDAEDIAVALYDGDELIAGASGRTEFQRLYVSYLWVDADHRGEGFGGDCLRQLEAMALKRG